MKVSISSRGSFVKTEKFLKTMSSGNIFRELSGLAEQGVKALASATPSDSGETANSWKAEVKLSRGSYTIKWTNSHIVNGVPIAIILQYGHATGTGGYVQGRDYINPAIKPIFNQIADRAWKAVTSA